jgi:hypothetical protein
VPETETDLVIGNPLATGRFGEPLGAFLGLWGRDSQKAAK